MIRLCQRAGRSVNFFYCESLSGSVFEVRSPLLKTRVKEIAS